MGMVGSKASFPDNTGVPVSDWALTLDDASPPMAQSSTERSSTEQNRAAQNVAAHAGRLREIVEQNFAFVWRCLRRLGVPDGSLDDATQHVFWILSGKMDQVPAGTERRFLFFTLVNVAHNTRRGIARRREVEDAVAELRHHADPTPSPDEL